jgi:NADPH:quinone reductase-like Zn-dependent oxidoreductase
VKAAVLHEVGGVPVYGDFAEPDPVEGHEIADVLAAGVNPVDLMMASGAYGQPEVPSVVGREGIARLADGRRVYFDSAPPPFGTIADRAPVDLERAMTVPEAVDDGLAVALGIAGLAGWLPLEFRARLQPGETVLVLGASGAVGQIAVQAAKLLGAGRVVAAGRHRATLEALRDRGADDVVVLDGDYAPALEEAGGDGFDVVVDIVFGPPLEAALAATAPGARLVSVGAAAGPATLSLGSVMLRTLTGHANGATPLDVRKAAYERMLNHAAAGELTIEIERKPLAQVAEAWAAQAQSPRHKIVLVP